MDASFIELYGIRKSHIIVSGTSGPLIGAAARSCASTAEVRQSELEVMAAESAAAIEGQLSKELFLGMSRAKEMVAADSEEVLLFMTHTAHLAPHSLVLPDFPRRH